MDKQNLLNGNQIIFNNDKWCIDNENDDFVEAEVFFSDKLGTFVIWFNGSIVSSTKTFKAMERKLNQLKRDWNLELNEIETV